MKLPLSGSSADANVPIALGIPAIIGGGGESSGWNTCDAWYDPRDAWQGAPPLQPTLLGLVGLPAIVEPVLEKRPTK